MNELPVDVLVIRYPDLSSDPTIRLEICQVIGQLMENTNKSLSLADLDISPAAHHALCEWLNGKKVQRFWQINDQVITVNEPCTRHLLIGTRYLLADLNQIKTKQLPDLGRLDVLWQAAAQLLAE